MKGVSDKDAQNNKKIKGDKNNFKKPLQVLHISKKDTISKKEEVCLLYTSDAADE